jgi:hypothetical protein
MLYKVQVNWISIVCDTLNGYIERKYFGMWFYMINMMVVIDMIINNLESLMNDDKWL